MTYSLSEFLEAHAALPAGETSPELETARAAVNEEANRRFHDPVWRYEQAALVSEAIDQRTRRPDFAPGVLSFRSLNRGDRLQRTFKTGGIKIFEIAAGGYVEESTVSNDVVEAGHSNMSWHVVGTPEEALADWAETMQAMVAAAELAEANEILRRQFALLEAATVLGGPQHVDASVGGITPTVLQNAIIKAADHPRPETGRGLRASDVVVIGRMAGVGDISAFPGFSQNMLDTVNETGRLGRFRGARIEELVNTVDSDGVEINDPTDVWVVSSDCGEFATFGAPRVNSWVEEGLDKFHTKSRRDTGGVVWVPEGIVRITIA